MSKYNNHYYETEDFSIDLSPWLMDFSEFMEAANLSEKELLNILLNDPDAPTENVISFSTFYESDVAEYIRKLEEQKK